MKGFIVYITYKLEGSDAVLHYYGRLENGESFLVRKKDKPYFWIKTSDVAKAKQIVGYEIINSDFKNFNNEPVSKVIVDVPRSVPDTKKALGEVGITSYEADIRFAYKYLFDKDIKGSMEISGDFTKGKYVNRIYDEPKLSPCEYVPSLKVLSIDIESNMEGDLYCISLYGCGASEVLVLKDQDVPGHKTYLNEYALLLAFKERIHELDPDVIAGWNVIDFDFKLLKKKFEKNGIPFNLGREDRECTLELSDSYYKDSSADFMGRVVLDGIHLMKISFVKLDDYKLDTAASHFLGEHKTVTAVGLDKVREITRMYNEDILKLVEYNLKDSKLVIDIFDKSGVLGLAVARSLLTGMPLDRVNASVASLDSLYIRELTKLKYVAPTTFVQDRTDRIKGGFVRASIPGIYKNILVLDFKSLYPSIMRTFNIDPLGFVPSNEAHKYTDLIKAPNGACFKNQDGILPNLLASLWSQRDAAKARKDKLASNAIKITMNSFFGVLANPACRFYSLEMGNAITHFGQFLIKLCADKVEEMGYTVIYGDTDSIFVHSKVPDYDSAIKIGNEIQDYMNGFYTAYIRKNYNRESFLELEFEKTYSNFMMPGVRGSDEGAKKRYAGLLVKEDGSKELSIVGLEFVRRDWTEASKEFQFTLLDMIFNDKKIDSYIKEFVDSIKAGKKDSLLVYRKAIRKDVAEYTKTTPPHIQAARKLGRTDVGLIEYVMTMNGPEPVEKKTASMDYGHYIDKQIRPIAETILHLYGKTFEEVMQGNKQVSLLGF